MPEYPSSKVYVAAKCGPEDLVTWPGLWPRGRDQHCQWYTPNSPRSIRMQGLCINMMRSATTCSASPCLTLFFPLFLCPSWQCGPKLVHHPHASKRAHRWPLKSRVARRKAPVQFLEGAYALSPFFVRSTDANCVCLSDAFANSVVSCVVSQCSAADTDAAVTYFGNLCSGSSTSFVP